MINLCCDFTLYNLDIQWLEDNWVDIYNTNKKPHWPELKSFSEFENLSDDFKTICRKVKLDPKSQKERHGFREIPYPTCTRHNGVYGYDSWGEFSTTYPNTEHVRLIDYLYDEGVPYKLWKISEAPIDSFYIIGLNIFHPDFDYFSEISNEAYARLKRNEINVLFFYDEADNPIEIKKSLSTLCQKHDIDIERIHFVSGNTYADKIENFYYFFDDELLYRRSQQKENIVPYHEEKREKKFTALVRIHKLWRAIFMGELWRAGVHDQGFFSYNQISQGKESDEVSCQPFDREFIESKYRLIQNFLADGPFKADSLNDIDHNSFESLNKEHFEKSYCNFVVETYFNMQDNIGTCLTEKIIKPICHNQFFIVVGPPHTLKELKKFGYKTFDRVIDESYDDIENDQKRMEAVIELCSEIASMPDHRLHKLYLDLKPEITHNSKLFLESKKERLTDLISKLQQ